MIKFYSLHYLNYPLKNNRKMALQVHDRLSFASFPAGRTVPRRRTCSASLTLEAALVLPIFLFFVYLLILPMRMMDTARSMQEICEAVCRDAAEGSYLLTLRDSKTAKGADDRTVSGARSVQAYLKGNALGLLAVKLAQRQVDDQYVMNLHALRSHGWGDDQMITLTMDYDYRLPFSVLGLRSLHQTVRASRHAWVGSPPRSKSGASSGDDEDPLVYIGAHGTRYHSSLRCHYLSNDLTAVSFSDIRSKRNANGGTYHACPRCAASCKSGAVYIMQSGSAYHTDPNCSAICAHARAVKKSEVAYLGPCQYCCQTMR